MSRDEMLPPPVGGMTEEEQRWCIEAPTAEEAFRRTMKVLERITGHPIPEDRQMIAWASFCRDLRSEVERRGRTDTRVGDG